MSNKVIVIISTSEASKANTGIAFALNALKKDWLEDVKLFVFGPAEELLLRSVGMQNMLKEFQLLEGEVVACKAIADREGLSDGIVALGVPVEFVGKMISDLISDGYAPMVW